MNLLAQMKKYSYRVYLIPLSVLLVVIVIFHSLSDEGPRSNFGKGLDSYRAGDLDGALKYISNHIEFDYKNVSPALDYAYMLRAQVKNRQSRFKEAIPDAEKALEVNPYSIYSRIELAASFEGLKEYEKALQILQEAEQRLAKSDREDPSIYLKKANIYEKIGNIEKAEEYYSHAIEVDSRNIIAHQARGHFYTRIKRFEEAVVDYTSTINLDPKNLALYNNRSSAYMSSGKTAEAEADLKTARGD